VANEELQRLLKTGFIYFMAVPIKKPGAYQLRAALRDHGSERVGSASQFVEVPDIKKNRLTLSGVVAVAMDRAALNQRVPGQAQTPGSQPSVGQNPERDEVSCATNSAAVRQFQRGQVLQYGFVIYNARLDKTTGQPQLHVQARLFRSGQPVFMGKDQPLVTNNPPDLKRISVNSAIQLGTDMTPGEYVLQVITTDALADQKHRTAAQSIDFEIVR